MKIYRAPKVWDKATTLYGLTLTIRNTYLRDGDKNKKLIEALEFLKDFTFHIYDFKILNTK